jgi:DNA-directed RNA polymerase subunit alpha
LLASLPGAAITSVQIAGIRHEFQDIPDVLEDVTDLVQALKQVRLRCFSDHPVTMRVDRCGERTVTAADIVAPSTVEIVNPTLHLATLDNSQAHLVLDLVVQNGRGFVSAAEQVARLAEPPPIGLILIDAIYSPIRQVTLLVEPLSRGRDENTDLLVLEITTDGTISPDEALRESAAILRQQCAVVATYTSGDDVDERGRTVWHVPIPASVYQRPLEALNLSARTYHCLRRHGCVTIGHILEMEEDALRCIRNLGEKTLCEVADRLHWFHFLSEARAAEKAKQAEQVTP